MICTTLRSDDVLALAHWLSGTLGLTPGYVAADHAELFWHGGAVLLGPRRPDDPWDTGGAVTYLVVDDPDAHHARVVAAGGEIVLGLTDQDYGSREFAVVDAEGNRWSFGTYRPTEPVSDGTNRAY
ncbi:VOC family protein [Actinomycetospora soli]|uniref:VOC family protein n=1 Tax=Actinomycetospora soli TaxID=2893887 RepID=UPI001E55F984|nr:VOC family protein [Actinomycetospora soli]MCD2186486.1 glyoxalase [Actinomycetospora soli]